MSSKTTHVISKDDGWAIFPEGSPRASSVFSTQKEALTAAKDLLQKQTSGQIVVHGRDGSIRYSEVHGLPKVQPSPHKSSLGTKNIEKAVYSLVLDSIEEK
jgi:hypothetical protein